MDKTAYFILELAFVSEGNNFKESIHNSLQLAKVAEENNFKRFWFAEHHNAEIIASNATPLLIGYVAENITRIRVGSGGIMLPNHSPLIIAEQFDTLAQLYPGRIDLGLGRALGTDIQTAEVIRSDFRTAVQSFPEEVSKIETYFSVDNKNSKVRAAIGEGTRSHLYFGIQ
ncbi:MsnO8 family LLM class oxidoreductase [Chryseobacterium muglaense]|uniref:MsnO8 family LLM class oxidoreductase n=1 Tax=Chryseobacterium muglaense TaxID=2893752 RepID=UPI00293BB181|nr:MsnO8 family LLM class oxidoreductase [Chryseobacterium muglaense]